MAGEFMKSSGDGKALSASASGHEDNFDRLAASCGQIGFFKVLKGELM
jgi:hypothetical protein